MKTSYENQEDLWPSPRQLKELREKLHREISHDEVKSSSQLEAFDQIIALLQLDPTVFHQMWIQPLLNAGASLDVAYACIAESYFLPN